MSNAPAASSPEIRAVCPNCGRAATGKYCAECGQRQERRPLALRHLLADVADEQLSLNAAVPRTMAALLKPGLLTVDYVQGRIARYIPPLRLYIMTSFVFFFALSLLGDRGGDNFRVTAEPEPSATTADSTGFGEDDGFIVSLARMFGGDAGVERLHRMSNMPADELNRQFARDFLSRLPIAVFLLVPLVAGLLKLVYLRSRRFYAEHFIFTLHLHTVVFLVFTLQLLLAPVPLLPDLLLLILPVYAILALMRVHRQGVLKTTFKFAIVAGLYLTALVLVLIATVFYSLLTMPV